MRDLREFIADNYNQVNEVFENKYIVYWKEGEIIHACYRKNAIIGKDAAREIIALRRKSYPESKLLLVDMANIEFVSKEAKIILASEESLQNVVKGAILVKSFLQKVMGNLFLGLVNTPSSTKIFTDKKAAIEWLLKGK